MTRVLFLSHTGRVSGAEHTLLELCRALNERDAVEVACPPGDLERRLRTSGVRSVRLGGTDAGLKLHPVRTPLAVASMLLDGIRARLAARRMGAEVIHANSTRAALIGAVACSFRGPALVTHAHDVLGDDRVSRLVRRVIQARSSLILAVSTHVRESLGDGEAPVVVVYNPVDIGRFERVERETPTAAPSETPTLIVVGQITPWKGQDTAIEALARLSGEGASARLLIVGEPVFSAAGTRHDNEAYMLRLRSLVSRLGLDSRVDFLGRRENVPELLRSADLTLVPSWEEPFGRVVIESMAAGTPVIATSVGGPAEILAAGGGRLVIPRNPEALALAVDELLGDSGLLTRLAAEGRAGANRYRLEDFVTLVDRSYVQAITARTH